jgi:tRNA A37 threonylcarbamoyladenosine dehydratase
MRQRFHRRDVGKQKTAVLETRLRMFSEFARIDCHNTYMTQELMKKLLEQDAHQPKCFISCVDNNTSRNRILTVLKPDTAVNQSPYPNWLYIDSGNTAYDGWTSMLVSDDNGVITGVDMRNQDGAMRANENNDAPIISGQGCGRRSAPYQTATANQRNADLIAAQLTSHLKSGRSFGLIAWTVPNMESEEWASTTYETAHLCPINT